MKARNYWEYHVVVSCRTVVGVLLFSLAMYAFVRYHHAAARYSVSDGEVPKAARRFPAAGLRAYPVIANGSGLYRDD